MILKVVNGTCSNQKRLCETCSSSVIMRGASGKGKVAFGHRRRRSIPIQTATQWKRDRDDEEVVADYLLD